jgi:hypothetical protein
MSLIPITCINNLFKSYDYNNLTIKKNILEKHNTNDNAWITIDNNVYSIRKDDRDLLEIFKDFYGKNIKEYLLNESIFDIKKRIIILDKLKKRKIGILEK